MEYKQKLGNVDATLNTTDKLMRVADPKRVLGTIYALVIVIVIVVISVWLLKKIVGNNVESVWEILAGPFKNLSARYKAAGKLEDVIKTTGQNTTISPTEAEEIANSIDSCVTNMGLLIVVNEFKLNDILRNRVRNAANYRLVEGKFGTRYRNGWGGKTYSFTLKSIMTDHCTTAARSTLRSTLAQIGITNEI